MAPLVPMTGDVFESDLILQENLRWDTALPVPYQSIPLQYYPEDDTKRLEQYYKPVYEFGLTCADFTNNPRSNMFAYYLLEPGITEQDNIILYVPENLEFYNEFSNTL